MVYVAEKFKVFMDIKRSSGTTIKQFIAKYESIFFRTIIEEIVDKKIK